MDERLSSCWLIIASVLLAGCSLWQTSCVQYKVVAGSPLATPKGAATLTPIPTRADGKPVSARPYRITPLPGEKVRVGDITEVVGASTPVPPRYSIRNERNDKYIYSLFVRDSKTGQEIRLGDDNGNASFGAMTDQYIIWRFAGFTHNKTPDPKTGLFAYVLATGKEITIAGPEGYQWYPKIDDQWVIYLDVSGSDYYYAGLRAHNLKTGEDFQLSKQVPYNRPGEYYAISGNRIAWVNAESGWAICVYDLATRAR
jgi:hypothetical protein